MTRYGGVADQATADELAAAAVRALKEALHRPGRDREGAFALLAADGLLTAAVEDFASSEDPEGAFESVLLEVAKLAEGAKE